MYVLSLSNRLVSVQQQQHIVASNNANKDKCYSFALTLIFKFFRDFSRNYIFGEDLIIINVTVNKTKC